MYSPFEPEATSEPMSTEARLMLERYLRHACSAEEAVVSPEEQEDLRAEMSGHILALAAAHRELGSSEEEAMQAALQQFGKAEQIGRAVGREIGKRPSFLGSPHTVSMIGGILANGVILGGANFLLACTGSEVISPEAHLLGIALGCITGSVLWKSRRTVIQAARWNARFCAGTTIVAIAAMFTAACFWGGTPERFLTVAWMGLAVTVLLKWIVVAWSAGACSGALTGLWCRLVRKQLTDTEHIAPPETGGTLSA